MAGVFTAVRVPTHLADSLAVFAESQPWQGRKTCAADMHVTLRFFGDISIDVLAPLYQYGVHPFPLLVKGVGFFHIHSEIVLYAAVHAPSEWYAFQDAHEQLARTLNLPARLVQVPHITLCRHTDMSVRDAEVWCNAHNHIDFGAFQMTAWHVMQTCPQHREGEGRYMVIKSKDFEHVASS